MAASDAKPFPVVGQAYRHYFDIRNGSDNLVSGAANLDTEVSIDGAAFVDATNEATEIGSSGIYYIDLTAAEMNGNAICLITKTTTTGAKTDFTVLYPIPQTGLSVNTSAIQGIQTAASVASVFFSEWSSGTIQADNGINVTLDAAEEASDDFYNGSVLFIYGGTGTGQARRIINYVGATKVATLNDEYGISLSTDSDYVIIPDAL